MSSKVIAAMARTLQQGLARVRRTLVLTMLCLTPALANGALLPVTPEILAEQRTQWEMSGVTNYVYDGSITCFCLPSFVEPHRVTVSGGVVTELLFVDTLLPDPNPSALLGYLPVEGIFDLLEERLEAGWETVDAMFDEALGFPVMYFTEFSMFIGDSDFTFVIDSFTVLPEPMPVPASAGLVVLSLATFFAVRRKPRA